MLAQSLQSLIFLPKKIKKKKSYLLNILQLRNYTKHCLKKKKIYLPVTFMLPVMFTCEAFIIKVVIFQFSANTQKHAMRHFSSQNWKEVVSFHARLQAVCRCCLPQRGCWPAGACLQSVAREECPAPVSKSAKDENGGKDSSKTEIYTLFLQHCLRILKETFKKKVLTDYP